MKIKRIGKLASILGLTSSSLALAAPVTGAHCLVGNGFAGSTFVETSPGVYLAARSGFGLEKYKIVLDFDNESNETRFSIYIKTGYLPEQILRNTRLPGNSLRIQIVNNFFECDLER